MANETLWQRATEGELWGAGTAQTLEAQFRAARGSLPPPTDREIATWLRQQGVVTAWQADVLETGEGGPFRLGDYWLESRIQHPQWPEVFAARHVPTKFPVVLYFAGGESVDDWQRWESLARRFEDARQLTAAAWLRYFERVELAEYRFLVGERVELATVAQKLGHRGRTPWPSAVASVVRIALALQQLRATDLEGMAINSRNVYLQAGGAIRIVPPVLVPDPRWSLRASPRPTTNKERDEDADPGDLPADYQLQGDARTTRTDQEIYALGVLLYRLIRGETLRAAARLPDGSWSAERAVEKISKYELPPALVQLLKSFATPQWRSPWSQTAAFAQALMAIGGDSARLEAAATSRSPEEDAYLESIRRWQPGAAELGAPSAPIVIAQPAVEGESLGRGERFRLPLNLPVAGESMTPAIRAASTSGSMTAGRPGRRASAWGVWGFAALTLAACTAAAYLGYRRMAGGRPSLATAPVVSASESVGTSPGPSAEPAAEASSEPTLPAVRDGQDGWKESLVADDGQHLWQSPTTGPPLDLGGLPLGPAIVAYCRPADIWQRDGSDLMGQALGPIAQAWWSATLERFGVPATVVEEMVIGWYADEQQQLRPCYLLRLREPQLKETFVGRWQVQGFQASGTPEVFRKDRDAFALIPMVPPNASDSSATVGANPVRPELIAAVLAGPADLLSAALEAPPANPLVGPLERLLPRTQRQRLLTVLATRAALTSDALETILPPPFTQLRGGFDQFLPDSVRAVALSADWSDAIFAELVCEATVDLRASELVLELNQRIRAARENAALAAAASAASPYWDRVRLRFDNMISDLCRQTRVAAEQGQVLANVWLPLPAGHNLIAATELVLATQRGAAPGVASAPPSIPTDLTQLLATRFTLRDANPPDLNILVDTLQTMVRDRFPQLPFALEIRLSNAELKEAGITRNQRPGPLALVDQTLEQILTAIVFGANPDKNAQSPADPRCKLIWVAIPPKETGPAVILLTTRDGATKQRLPLPSPFLN